MDSDLINAILKPDGYAESNEDELNGQRYDSLHHLVIGAHAIAVEGERKSPGCMNCWHVNELLGAFLAGMERDAAPEGEGG